MRFLLPILLISALSACPKEAEKPTPHPVYPEEDAGGATCESACANMRALHCKLGETTPRGVKCEELCKTVREENAGAGFPIGCLASAKTCVQAEACR